MEKYYQSLESVHEVSTLHLSEKELGHYQALPAYRKLDYVKGRLVLKRLFCDIEGKIDLRQIETSYRGHKPYFLDRPDLHVSLAHSGYYVAAAISGTSVGIDIEIAKPSKMLGSFIASKEELQTALRVSGKSVERAISLLWCAKEAVFKADCVDAPPWEYQLSRDDEQLIVNRGECIWEIKQASTKSYGCCSALLRST